MCGVPFTIALLISMESQSSSAESSPRNCWSAESGLMSWEGSPLQQAELNQFLFLNVQTFDSLLCYSAWPLLLRAAGMACVSLGNRLLSCYSLFFHFHKSPNFETVSSSASVGNLALNLENVSQRLHMRRWDASAVLCQTHACIRAAWQAHLP